MRSFSKKGQRERERKRDGLKEGERRTQAFVQAAGVTTGSP
jgi:hypothetical protein